MEARSAPATRPRRRRRTGTGEGYGDPARRSPLWLTFVAASRVRLARSDVVAAQRLANRIGDLLRWRLAAEIRRVQLGIAGYALHRPHQPVGRILLAQVLQHHRTRPERRDGVGDALARDVESRTVDRLEH